MGGIADHGLVKVTDLNGERSSATSYGSKVANVTVAADPNRRPGRDLCMIRLV